MPFSFNDLTFQGHHFCIKGFSLPWYIAIMSVVMVCPFRHIYFCISKSFFYAVVYGYSDYFNYTQVYSFRRRYLFCVAKCFLCSGILFIRPTYRRYDGTITFIQRGVNVCLYVPLSGCPHACKRNSLEGLVHFFAIPL